MDLTVFQLGLFLGATFAAALVAGVTGFAFALIAAAVWLHILTPLQTATLTIGYGLIVQGYGFWKMRHAFNWEPALAVHRSAARPASRSASRCCAGPIPPPCASASRHSWCCIRSMASRGRRSSRSRPAPPPTSVVGFFSGLLGAMAGFPGIIIVIWCSLRGWPRDVQRAVFQPVERRAAGHVRRRRSARPDRSRWTR